MACTSAELEDVKQHYIGGSVGRTRHSINRSVIYTAGVEAVAEKAEAYWLLDLIALQFAPRYAAAWQAGTAGVGVVTLTVKPDTHAQITLSLEDDMPNAEEVSLEFTTFPEGTWIFYLGTDQLPDSSYVTTILLPEEY